MNFFDLCALALNFVYNILLAAGILFAFYYTKSPWVFLIILLVVFLDAPRKQKDQLPPSEQDCGAGYDAV